MASRTAKVASSIVVGILAGALLTVPRDAAKAGECLTEPRQDAPQGQHWYYRIEHGTKRHCWYIREEGGKVSQAAPPDDSVQAPKAVVPTSENPPSSFEDAHAEYPVPQGSAAAPAAPVPSAPPASSSISNPPQADTQGSAVAARWPSPENAMAPAAPPATAESADDPVPATDAAPTPNPAPTADAAPASVAASPVPTRPSVSLQMLFAVIGGALALAGLTASVVYRFGRGRKRRLDPRERRAAIWEGVDTGPKPPWVEPVIEQTAPRPNPERRATQGATAQERYKKIEEILAQLVKQAQESDA